MNYVWLGLVAVALLAGLITIGVGNRRWSWGTVAAAILTLLMACGYLVVAARLASYEFSWKQFVERKQAELSDVRDGLVPQGPGGQLVAAADKKSLARLADEKVRWQRALDRIDSWRGAQWSGCSFTPPTLGDKPADGSIELNLASGQARGADAVPGEEAAQPAADAAEKSEKGTAPIDAGAVVYLFEDYDKDDYDKEGYDKGSRYLGTFSVKAVAYDAAKNTCELKVAATEPPDAYDKKVWRETYEGNVTVYSRLPNDCWLTFSTTAQTDDGTGTMPPLSHSLEDVEARIKKSTADEAFVGEVGRHLKAEQAASAELEEDDLQQLLQRLKAGEVLPGEYWARVKVTKTIDTLGATLEDEDAKRELPEGSEVEFDLQTAFDLQEKGFCTIEQVRYRRPLRDGGAFLNGGLVDVAGKDGGPQVPIDGIAGLAASLRREIDALRDQRKQLQAAKQSLEAEAKATNERKLAYADDLQNWLRDAAEAATVAAAFEAELKVSEARLESESQAVVERARELRAAMGKLVARIDAAAPPPARGAAAAP